MASIQKRGLTYRARIIRRGYPSQSKTFGTRLEAVKWARNIEAQIDSGTLFVENAESMRILAEALPFSEAVNRYIESHSVHKKNYRSEASILKILAKRWGSKTIYEINKSEVLGLRNDLINLGRCGDTINHYFNAISKLYQMLTDELSIEIQNPIKLIKRMPASKGRSARLTGKAEEIFIEYCKKSNLKYLAPVVSLAIETGMRQGEIMGIKWSDIDLESRRIYLHKTKNGESRQVPLTLKAVEIINNLKSENTQSDRLFPCSTISIRKGFQRVRLKAKSQWTSLGKNPFDDLRFHDLRHEALSRLSDAGLNVIELSHISGHKTMSMLKRYTHPSHEAIFAKLDMQKLRVIDR